MTEVDMKGFRLASTTALVVLLGSSLPGFTQEAEEHAKPRQQEEPAHAAPSKPQDARPPQRETPRPEQGKEQKVPQQEQKGEREPDKHPQGNEKMQNHDRKPQAEPERRSNDEPRRQMQPAQQGSHEARRGGRIPEEHFRAHFGRPHTFVINRPVIVDNRPRFQYSGYWFEIVDPWPADWAYTDDCYIDYVDDSYYLFDPFHPGMRLAIVVVM
jgi:hypothetical protein